MSSKFTKFTNNLYYKKIPLVGWFTLPPSDAENFTSSQKAQHDLQVALPSGN